MARKECQDRDGKLRVTGEEWLVRRVGAYLPGAYEEVVDLVKAYVLTEKVCNQSNYSKTPVKSLKFASIYWHQCVYS